MNRFLKTLITLAAMLGVGTQACSLIGSFALAQSTWTVQTLIPDAIAIRVPSTQIYFGFEKNFPPEKFPARYTPTLPKGGILNVEVFSNVPGVWNLLLEIPDIRNKSGVVVVPAKQLFYRVNDGAWLHADGTPQILFSQAGATAGWQAIKIEFALELIGNEPAGEFVVPAIISAIRQP
jgi:hypothetical protein